VVPFSGTKLYGGQQFERLLAEFKALTLQLQIPSNQLRSLPNQSDKQFYYLVCEITQNRTEDAVIPLIQQLLERATFVMKRIPVVVEHIMNNKEANSKQKVCS
jgi:hypothetical protein